MKTYINKTRFQRRIVFEKAGKTETVFLRSGQSIERKETAKFVEEGIKVRDAAKSTTTSKKTESQVGKE